MRRRQGPDSSQLHTPRVRNGKNRKRIRHRIHSTGILDEFPSQVSSHFALVVQNKVCFSSCFSVTDSTALTDSCCPDLASISLLVPGRPTQIISAEILENKLWRAFGGISGLNETEHKGCWVLNDILAGKTEIHWPSALSQTAVEPFLAMLLSGLGICARDFCLGAVIRHPGPLMFVLLNTINSYCTSFACRSKKRYLFQAAFPL